jgi:hypothetical protein
MNPMFKPPGTKRLKPRYSKLLSIFAFNFNIRRYNLVCELVLQMPAGAAPYVATATDTLGWGPCQTRVLAAMSLTRHAF